MISGKASSFLGNHSTLSNKAYSQDQLHVSRSLEAEGAQLLSESRAQARRDMPVIFLAAAAGPQITSCIFLSHLHRACSSSSVCVLAHKAQPDPLADLHQGGGGKHPLPACPEHRLRFSATQPVPIAFPASFLPPGSIFFPAPPCTRKAIAKAAAVSCPPGWCCSAAGSGYIPSACSLKRQPARHGPRESALFSSNPVLL